MVLVVESCSVQNTIFAKRRSYSILNRYLTDTNREMCKSMENKAMMAQSLARQ